MSRLSENNRVLYIEAQLSILHILKNGLGGLKRIKQWLKGLRSEGRGLYLYTPIPLLPFGNYFIFINHLNQLILGAILRRLARRLGFRKPLLWVYCINSAPLLKRMSEKLSIYYCIDDFPSEINIAKRMASMLFLENYALRKADIVFACTRTLAEQRKKNRPDIHFLRNGVDFTTFDIKEGGRPVPEDIRDISSPRIGVVGTLDSRIDSELILYLAQNKKEWQIVLVGKSLKQTRDFRRQHNIHLLGLKNRSLIASYIMALDVCIIPYRTQSFQAAIFPLKTLEYLACGKPVVSTYLPELEEFKDVVRLSRTREEFIDNIELSLKNKGMIEKRKKVASGASWENMMREMLEIISAKS